MSGPHLSDKALAVFAFAAFHQLESGQKVSKVVRRDGAGHKADDEAVAELTERGLISIDGDYINLTADAERMLEQVIQGMRQALSG
jgi:coproporphyrinogen III oxidase-like Fe-S oxidoreductase